MKKSLIAAAGTTLAVAALPAVGVFAATSGQFTDELTVTVEGGCTMEDNAAVTPGTYSDRSFSATIDAGTSKELGNGFNSQTGRTIKISCNTTTGNWAVRATATGLTDSNISKTIAPGVATSGNTSAWAIKSNAENVTDANNPYKAYKGWEADNGQSYSTFLTGAANAQTAATFNPSYQVYVAPNQDPGTYTGSVVYSIVLGN